MVATDLELALGMADLADSITLARFAEPIVVETKPDGTPVTAADREVEEALHDYVLRYRPGDGFLGEELGSTGRGSRRWIVDGIDGTHNFVRHLPEWGTLVSLEDNGEVAVGVASAPATRRRWWARRGGGSWTVPLGQAPPSAPERLAVSSVTTLRDARIVVMPPAELAALRTGMRGRVAEAVEAASPRRSQSPVNGYVPLLVAEGQLDLSVHLWGGPWDHAALVVIVEEAGGSFSDLWGGRRLDTETAVYSNGPLGENSSRSSVISQAHHLPTRLSRGVLARSRERAAAQPQRACWVACLPGVVHPARPGSVSLRGRIRICGDRYDVASYSLGKFRPLFASAPPFFAASQASHHGRVALFACARLLPSWR